MTPAQHNVLIVEDDPDDRDLIERAFRKASIDVPRHFAIDGEEAVAYLTEAFGRPDLPLPTMVLLDLKLPRRSGFEVLTWIKTQDVLKRIPVVVLTSSRENVDLKMAYDLGANSYLVKPARSEALLQMIRSIDAYWLTHHISSP